MLLKYLEVAEGEEEFEGGANSPSASKSRSWLMMPSWAWQIGHFLGRLSIDQRSTSLLKNILIYRLLQDSTGSPEGVECKTALLEDDLMRDLVLPSLVASMGRPATLPLRLPKLYLS
jgi:hypothetical protein